MGRERIYDYTTNPPTSTAAHSGGAGNPAASFEDAIAQELHNAEEDHNYIDADNLSATPNIDANKLEFPMLPLVWSFGDFESDIDSDGTSEMHGSTPLFAGPVDEEQGRYQVLGQFCIPDLPNVGKVDFSLVGAIVFAGLNTNGVNEIGQTMDLLRERQFIGFSDYTSQVSNDAKPPALWLGWTDAAESFPDITSVIPLTKKVPPKKTQGSDYRGAFHITPEHVEGGGRVRIRDGGRVLVIVENRLTSLPRAGTNRSKFERLKHSGYVLFSTGLSYL